MLKHLTINIHAYSPTFRSSAYTVKIFVLGGKGACHICHFRAFLRGNFILSLMYVINIFNVHYNGIMFIIPCMKHLKAILFLATVFAFFLKVTITSSRTAHIIMYITGIKYTQVNVKKCQLFISFFSRSNVWGCI